MALMKFRRTALPEKVSRIGKKVTAKLRTLVCFQVFPRDHGFVNPLSRLSLPSFLQFLLPSLPSCFDTLRCNRVVPHSSPSSSFPLANIVVVFVFIHPREGERENEQENT